MKLLITGIIIGILFTYIVLDNYTEKRMKEYVENLYERNILKKGE